MAAAAKPRKKAAKGHKLPEPVPEGFQISDTTKKTWLIGKEIGSGGFGRVYYGASAAKPKEQDFVIKVEHHGNGPLFAEMHCYQKIGKPDIIAEWTKKKKLDYLGLSPCYGTGSYEYDGSKYRFMVIERYGTDLQKILEENQKVFPLKTVYQIGISVVYLVDMGLACKYARDGVHKAEAADPKKAHNGTLEFTSRDAHRGAFARRSDLEILAFNLLQWLTGSLPWENSPVPKTHNLKEKYMNDLPEFFEVLFPESSCPDGIAKFVSYVSDLPFEVEPDYNHCRKLFKDSLKKLGCKDDVLVFKVPKINARSPQPMEVAETSNKENQKRSTSKRPTKRKETAAIFVDPTIICTPAMLEIMNKKRSAENAAKIRKK